MNWAIEFEGCEEIATNAARVLSRWDAAVSDAARAPGPKARAIIRRAGQKWEWHANGAPPPRCWHKLPPKAPMHVVCEVHDVVIDWYLALHRDLLCLHGAAAMIGGGLVCFPARGHAGKSTLIAHLLHLGQRVFCDDVLAIEPDTLRGKSLGLLPRLRAPLPRRTAPEVRKFLRDHTLFADGEWIYVDPGPSRLAKLDESAPFRALVFLERQNRSNARFETVKASEMLKELILQNIARKIKAAAIFETLHTLVRKTPRYRLIYSDPLEAAGMIATMFDGAAK
jgi:hypothetical protein